PVELDAPEQQLVPQRARAVLEVEAGRAARGAQPQGDDDATQSRRAPRVPSDQRSGEAAVSGSRRVHGVPEELHITMGGAVGRAVAVEIAMHIVEGGLDDARVVELLHTHLIRARAETAPGSAHALDLSGLRAPEVTFWSAWEGDAVVGVGALKRLSADHGEVKSMHTAETARGRGSAMLRQIMAAARAQGMSRLSLETGSWAYFA